MAVSGHNGNNVHIGMSSSISLSFYDSNNAEIKIANTKSLIDIIIPRDKNLPTYSYEYVNATGIGLASGAYFLPLAFNVTTTNASIHIELKPSNSKTGYLIILKLGYTPIVNFTHSDYDYFKILCPNSSKI